MGNAQTSHLIESEEDDEGHDSSQDMKAFCHQHKSAPISWSVKIDGKWTDYDYETAEQLEMVYASDASFVRLTKGNYFGKPSRSGLYAIKINRNTSPPTLVQINTATKAQYEVSRLCGEVSSECDQDVLGDGTSNFRSCQRSIGKTRKRHRENASNLHSNSVHAQSVPPRKRRRISNATGSSSEQELIINSIDNGNDDHDDSASNDNGNHSNGALPYKKQQCLFTYKAKKNQMIITSPSKPATAIYINNVLMEGNGTSMELRNGDIIRFGMDSDHDSCKMMVIKNDSKRGSKSNSKEKGKREMNLVKKKKQNDRDAVNVQRVDSSQPTIAVVVDKPPVLEKEVNNHHVDKKNNGGDINASGSTWNCAQYVSPVIINQRYLVGLQSEFMNFVSNQGGSHFMGNKTSSQKQPNGIWSYKEHQSWSPFDTVASTQIDNEIQRQLSNSTSTVITFPLTKGPWFGRAQNLGVYFCTIQLNSNRTQITSSYQTNNNTGFQRTIQRVPPLQLSNGSHNQQNGQNQSNQSNPSLLSNNNTVNTTNQQQPPSSFHQNIQNLNHWNAQYGNNNGTGNSMQFHFGANPNGPNSSSFQFQQPQYSHNPIVHSDGSVCWSWHDNQQWQAYDAPTISQIESAYTNGQNQLILSQGPYFGSSRRRGLYSIQFTRNSTPHQFVQINNQTGFQRRVERTGGNAVLDHSGDDQKEDAQSQWIQYYRPMTLSKFKSLKAEDRICNICFCDFEERDLFQNQDTDSKQDDTTNNAENTTSIDVTSTNETTNSVKSNVATNTNSNSIFNADPMEVDDDGDAMINDNDFNHDDHGNADNDKDGNGADPMESKEDVNGDNDNTALTANTASQGVISGDVIVHLSKCRGNGDHFFHAECIGKWLDEKGKCCHCQKRYAIETGNQPPGRLDWSFLSRSCSGYNNCNTIRVSFEFQGGIQGKEHYHPGQHYEGDYREGYFPNNEAGRECFELTKIAWERRLIFSIGTSLTNKRENRIVWTSIHYKTRLDGGEQRHGYPDKTYFDRFKEELKAKGVTTEDLDETAKQSIKNGYSKGSFGNHTGY